MATTKKKVIGKVSEAEANKALAQHAEADSQIQKLNAQIEIEINKIREKHAASLAAYQSKHEETLDILHAYAEQNPQLFTTKKSLEMQHGIIGFRAGQPKVEIKGITQKVAVGLMQNNRFLKEYVTEKVTLSIDKEKLIEKREDEKLMSKLNQVHVFITQDENFYIDLKKEAA